MDNEETGSFIIHCPFSVFRFMKFARIFIFLLFAAAFAAAQKPLQISIQGQLLKVNGKPLAYTELELVPTGANQIVIDSRLNAASGTDGKFTFANVPDGKYTLSINFGEKPSILSPYPEYFYPNTFKRSEAQIFEVTRLSKFPVVQFKMPAALAERKIAGRVLFADGTPVSGAYIGVRDVWFDRSVMFGVARTDKNGNFTVQGFQSREYQLGALLFENEEFRPELVNPIIAAGESKIFTLDAATPVIQFQMKTRGDFDQLRDKYIGETIFNSIDSLKTGELSFALR
jgi:hypothetical protein